MRIDVHAHYWAGAYLDAVQAAGRPDLHHIGRQKDDFDDRLAKLDAQGVDVQLLSAVGVNVEIPDASLALAPVQMINNMYADIATKYDGRFGAFASVTLPHVDLAIAESNRALGELGLQGIALPCIVDGKPIDHPDFEEFWANLNDRPDGTIIYVHPAGDDSTAHPGLTQFGLQFLFGSTMQIAMTPLRLGFSGLLTRYPKLKFIFALCGGTLPFLWQRLETNLFRGINASSLAATGPGMFAWMKDLPFDRDDPMSMFRHNMWYDTSVQDIPASLGLSAKTFGADRILLGSDEIFASLAEAIENIESSTELTADEKHAILDVNAQLLLKLPERERTR